jgi:hypothetical protein
LVNGRGPLGPEANAPNTLFSSCADGTAGEYHVDESLDQVRIYTVDTGGFLPGKQVTVEATVWASDDYTVDRLVLYYAPDANAPQWTHVATLQMTQPGAQVLTKRFTLSEGADLQAIRAIVRNNTYSGACASGRFADRDDLVFRLGDAAPQVSLSSPGELLSGTVTLAAEATDDILIDRVLFYAGANYLGYDPLAPYGLNWNTALLSDGTYVLTARAVDGSEQQAVSAPVIVVVDNFGPTVAFTAPSSGAVVSGSNITLQASAQDGNGVVRVEFFDGYTLLGTVTEEPYQLNWDTVGRANGTHWLYAEAYDAIGHVGTSSVRVTVKNDVPPTGNITSPAPNAVLSDTVTFSVRAQDESGVDRVTFYVGTRYVTWDGTAPYSINLNTLNFPNGDYVLTARIFDTTGHMTVTAGVPVTIQN